MYSRISTIKQNNYRSSDYCFFIVTFVDELKDGKTLHLLQSLDQELSVATEEQIKYVPHFHTIVQSGQYEYYASEGQKALRKYMVIFSLTQRFEFVFDVHLKCITCIHIQHFFVFFRAG